MRRGIPAKLGRYDLRTYNNPRVHRRSSWTTAVSCASTITHATTATCEATDDTAVCKATACDGGFVVSEDGLSCEAEEVPPTCTDGKMQCSGANDIQSCVDGSWAAAVSCVSLITNATTATCETTDDTAVCKATDCAEGFVVSEDGWRLPFHACHLLQMQRLLLAKQPATRLFAKLQNALKVSYQARTVWSAKLILGNH